MPQRLLTQDLTCCLDANPVLDRDNVYFSDQGWAYRHYKSEAKSNAAGGYWDEILVAGEALLANGNPDTSADDFGTPGTKTFLTGDGIKAPELVSGGISTYHVLDTATAFDNAGTEDVAATFSVGSQAGSAATGTVDTDADGNVIAITFATSGSGYVDGDTVTISEGGGAGSATFIVDTVA